MDRTEKTRARHEGSIFPSRRPTDFDDVDDVVVDKSPSRKLPGINGAPLSRQFDIVLGERGRGAREATRPDRPSSLLCQNSSVIHDVARCGGASYDGGEPQTP